MAQNQLDQWLTKEEAAEQTGISVRTLERLVQRRRIRQGYRRVPNRRPIAVLHPADLARIAAEMVGPVVDEPPKLPAPVVESTAVAEPEPAVSAPVPVVELLRSLLDHVQPRQWPLFLTLEQASTYTGLPQGTLTRYLAEGILSGVWVGAWRLRRTDLDAL